MSVTVRFPLLLISIPVRFALHLSLWSNLRSCLHVFVLLLSACSGSWLSVQVVLVAAVLLLRSLLLLLRLLFVAAPTAAFVLLQRPWLLQWVFFLATLRALFWLPLRCSFLPLLWALLSAASTGALSCLLLRVLLRWLLLGLLLSRDCFRCCRYFSLLLMLFLVKVRRRAGLLSSRLPGNLTMLFLMP